MTTTAKKTASKAAKKTAPKAAKKVATVKPAAAPKAATRITDDMLVIVIGVGNNPFRENTIQHAKGQLIINSSGKTVGKVKELRDGLVDSWALREMVKRGAIKVTTPKNDEVAA